MTGELLALPPHAVVVMTLLSSVTAAFRAITAPVTLAPVVTVTDAVARIVPEKVV